MKLFATLGALLVVPVAMAGEVGAQYPASVESSTTMTLAMAENGAGSSWAVDTKDYKATAHQTAQLNANVTKMNADLSEKLSAQIAEKVMVSLSK